MPKVSVIVPTYNCDKYIGNALRSILDQSFRDFEIIVIDDGSIDNTKEIIKNYRAGSQAKIKYIYQHNMGVSGARNRGIAEASGEYLAFLDADDMYGNKFLEKMIRAIECGYDWVICDNIREEKHTKIGNSSRMVVKRPIEQEDFHDLLRAFLVFDRVGSPNKMLVKKSTLIVNKIYFDTTLRSREDWDFCLQLLKKGCKMGWVQEPLVVYRIWDDNSNSTRKMGYKWLGYTLQLLKKYKTTFLFKNMNKELAQHYYNIGREYLLEKKDLPMCAYCIMMNLKYGGHRILQQTLVNKLKYLRQNNNEYISSR